MWVRVPLPDVGGPIAGFTFPRRDVLYVLTPGGLVRVALGPAPDVRRVAGPSELAEAYGPWAERLTWDGESHLVYDADGGDITLCDHPNGDRIVMDHDGTLLIMDPRERELRQRVESIRLTDETPWLFAGFSEDYRWLVACEPDGLQVFRHVPDTEPAAGTDRARS